jgi:opacity protein-like surface antigen
VRICQALLLAVALLVGSVAPARAEGFFTPYLGFNYGGDSSNCETLTQCEDKRRNFGFSFGSMGSVVGFEEDIAWATDFFGKVPGAENSVFTLMSNVLVGVGVGPVQPYFLAGVGLIRPHTSFEEVAGVVRELEKNSLGYDVGGGVNIYPSRHVGVRGDVRHLGTLQDVPILDTLTKGILEDQKLSFWRASIGIAFRF